MNTLQGMKYLLFYLLIISAIKAERKILADSEGETDISAVGWPDRYPNNLCSNSWNQLNNVYKTCSPITEDVQQNCTIKTYPYRLDNVNKVYVSMSTESRSCASQLHSKCQDNYKVYYGVKNDVNGEDRLINLGNIPGQVVYKPNGFAFKNISLSADVVNYKYITLFFISQYYCGSILSLQLYYFECPTSSSQLVDFPTQTAPSSGKDKIFGVCTQHSLASSPTDDTPFQQCSADGSSSVFGSCLCTPGYTKEGNKCRACENGKFKSANGNQPCLSCGANSGSIKANLRSCPCNDGFYRAANELNDYIKDCYAIPKVISGDIEVKQLTSTSANITWRSDYNNADFTGFLFECDLCPKDYQQIITKQYFVYMEGLLSFTMYNVSVAVTNNITNLTQQVNQKGKSFTTLLGTLPPVTDITKEFREDGSVKLLWKMPAGIANPNEVSFVIEYDGKKIETKEKFYVIEPGSEDQTLAVEIYLKVTKGGQTYVGQRESVEINLSGGGIALGLVIGVVVGVVVVLIVFFAIAFCVWKRKHPAYLQVVRMEDGTVKLPSRFLKLPGGKQLYVDPTTYNAVDDAVQEFANEINRSDLHIGQMLGGGEFAEVYKGALLKNGKNIDVAIKTLRHAAPKKDRDDFLSEAAILGQFNDPNVILIEGVVLRDGPNMIVLEFMENGALDKYLQNNDTKFTVLQLLGMARGVASGMKYLSELGYIHRDLAGRNVLVNDKQICKVSDFGMTREIKVDETYDTQGGKVPVRWTAPESIQFKKFTSASDIWSYGILLWEIMSFGERPYWDWQNIEVLERVNSGYRLPPPMSCPKVLHDLMLQCWNKDRTKRPKFHEIRDILEKWIRNPDSLQEIASVVTKTDENLDYTVLQTIYKWLLAIGMDRYTNNFIDQGFATPRQILDLTESDLEALGILPIGHRRKIYKAIKNTKMQVESRDSRHSSVSSRRKLTSFSKR